MPKQERNKSPRSLFVIAHNIRSLYNVGSIFRTSDAFGISKVYLTGYTGTPDNPKLAKTSLGAEVTVPWEYKKSSVQMIKLLKKEFPKLRIVGLENNLPPQLKKKLTSLDKFKATFPLVLVLGEEVGGIPKNLLPLIDQFIEIPMVGEKESLNVSVAYGIAAYALTR